MTTMIEDLKTEAKRLRTALAASGQTLSHSQSLEALARQKGYRDWNTLHAAIGNAPPGPPFAVGQHVTGRYLGHKVRGEIIGLNARSDGRYRVKLELDERVNVSAIEGMDVWRKRLNANVRRSGETVETTSDGQPHLALDL